jgi:3-hydroxyisobutyrate dehydrogenase/2-hydroxy-3-oxopropionate reductase
VAERIGAAAADTIEEAVAGADVVMTSLADDAAVVEVYTGPGGLGDTVDAGAVVLEMSTIAPRTVRSVATAIEGRGASLLDAPVSGSVAFAETGQLAVMAGGDPDALERAGPVLDAVAKRVFHLGPLGTGATMKLAVNDLIHAIDVGLSEALVLAEKAGIDRSAAYDVFAGGAAAAPFVLYKRAAFEDPDNAAVGFRLDLVGKDLDLILDLAGEVGARMDQATVNRALVGEAVESGLAAADISAVAVFLRGSVR